MLLSSDFRDLIFLLNKNEVNYLVVGGYATSIHARPRYTKDLDLWLEISQVNAERVLMTLQEFGFGSLGIVKEDFLTPGLILQLGYEPNRVDLLTSLQGLEFSPCFARRLTVTLGELSIPVIAKDDLIVNKKSVGRTRDLADVEDLESNGAV